MTDATEIWELLKEEAEEQKIKPGEKSLNEIAEEFGFPTREQARGWVEKQVKAGILLRRKIGTRVYYRPA